jgi:hypothetical protein
MSSAAYTRFGTIGIVNIETMSCHWAEVPPQRRNERGDHNERRKREHRRRQPIRPAIISMTLSGQA